VAAEPVTAEPVTAEPVTAEPVTAEPLAGEHGARRWMNICGVMQAAHVAGSGPKAAGGRAGQHAWDRFTPWWNASFAVTVAAAAAFAAAEVHGALRLAAVLALYAGLVMLYVLTLVRPLTAGSGGVRAGFIYLSGAFAIFTAGCFLFPGSALLLFILIPHSFMLLRLRPACVAVLGLALVNAGAELANNGVSTATVLRVALGGVLTLLTAIFLGNFIGRIIDQSSQRASLIEELERTRGELAGLSREAGALAERERLAGEIHDALAQGFTSVIMLVEAAQAALDRGDLDLARRQLALSEEAARDGLFEARSLIGALAPPALQGASLPGAIGRATEDLGARFGFATRFDVEGEPTPLSNNADIVLLRAAQEALVNVGRHAAATSASVTLRYRGKVTSLEVADDGVGFDVAQAAGFGLSQLRSRVKEVGGTAEVSSVLGEGTKIRVSIPTGGTGPAQLAVGGAAGACGAVGASWTPAAQPATSATTLAEGAPRDGAPGTVQGAVR
jgi:signal transduction histidine kinase